jgi:cellulose synthase/poly-beta-1,6-N-acetylglucosamine synthase-like glycosyltransferase
MSVVELVVIALVLFVTVEQLIAVAAFLVVCRRSPRPLADEQLPHALVVLALRGRDTSLVDCLRALFQLDYPRYRVRVIVDSPDDPAAETVNQVVNDLAAQNVEVQILESPSETCTLKCSALLQATADLDESIEVVAFLDADVVPHPKWLRELVGPLNQQRVGATMGNRWYAPQLQRWGSLVRYLWNIGSVVNMYYWKVPWGGTLAIKADLLRQSNLRDLWSRAGCDDVPLFSVLMKLRLRLVFVPSLLLLNRGDTDVARCLRFMLRQFLWVRLYHPVCLCVCAVFHILIVVSRYSGVLLLLLAALSSRWEAAGWMAVAVVANLVVTYGLIVSLELNAQRSLARLGQTVTANWWNIAMAMPFTEIVSAMGLIGSFFARNVEWRGVHYRIGGPWDIEMLDYHPLTGAENGRPHDRSATLHPS